MSYLFLILTPLSLTLVRIFQKSYRNCSLKAKQSSNIYVLINCITALVFFAVMAKGKLVPNIPTLIYSFFLAFFAVSSCILSLIALDKTDIINITVFTGAGGIILPFLFGVIFLKENFEISKIIACILLTLVIMLPLFFENKREKTSFWEYILCLILFVESGASTILFKLYAISDKVLDTNVFCFWGNAVMIPYILITALKGNRAEISSDIKKISLKAYIYAILSVLGSNLNSLFGIWALEKINITIYTIVTNAFALILTAVASRIMFSEKITKITAWSILLSVTAVILNAL